MCEAFFDPARLYAMGQPLLDWYRAGHRLLPWRETKDPYRIWLSEIMAQQTRVEVVVEYYHRFLAALPTVQALADAPEEQLLKLWEGLGYYNRARNLQKAARVICAEYGGSLPADPELLIKLPGIGSYTAGAISAICFDIPAPAVDGNVLRVVSRLCASEANIAKPAVKRQLENALKDTMPRHAPGDFNQALMELGATVCLPNGAPRCENCPLRRLCLAHEQGNERAFPVKDEKKARPVIHRTVFILRCGPLLAIQKRPAKGLLAGLWELPAAETALSAAKAKDYLRQEYGIVPLSLKKGPAHRHIFTHREWQMESYLADCAEPAGDFRWVTAAELADTYCLPGAFAPFAAAFLSAENK